MRDFLSRREYEVLKIVRPNELVLSRVAHEGTFKDLYDLPEPIRQAIYRYRPLDGADLVAFEVYEYSSVNPDHMLLVAVSEAATERRIECVGQYLPHGSDNAVGGGVFIRQPHAVDRTMIAEAEHLSRESWTSSQLERSEWLAIFVGQFFFAAGVLAWLGVYLFGLRTLHALAESPSEPASTLGFLWFLALFVGPVVGCVAGLGPFLQSWGEFQKRHRTIVRALAAS